MEYRPPVAPKDITTKLFRIVSRTNRRERRIYITASPQGAAIKVQAETRSGEPLGAPLFIFDREAAEVVGALVEAAAAAIGVVIPTPSHRVEVAASTASPAPAAAYTRAPAIPEKNHA